MTIELWQLALVVYATGALSTLSMIIIAFVRAEENTDAEKFVAALIVLFWFLCPVVAFYFLATANDEDDGN